MAGYARRVLDLDAHRVAAPPRDAATLVVVRDAPAGVEVFCVERQKVGFLGGAVVFPGGKLDPADLDGAWLIGDDPFAGWQFNQGILQPSAKPGLGVEPESGLFP